MLVAQDDLVVQYIQHCGAHAASLSISEVTTDCKNVVKRQHVKSRDDVKLQIFERHWPAVIDNNDITCFQS